MFDNLQDKMLSTLKKVRGQGKITEKNIQDTIKEIRLHLLEADVNFKVVKVFIDRVKQKALGEEVVGSLSAGQQFVKIVHEELVAILGGQAEELNVRGKPGVIFLVGLQGVGKTTTAAKLALHIRQKLKKKPGLIPADIYRPAAIDQLKTLAKQNNFPVFNTEPGQKPTDILAKARKWAEDEMVEVLIVDTAGRLHNKANLMNELEKIHRVLKKQMPNAPHEILLVLDATTGQNGLAQAKQFSKAVPVTGIALTKLDGTAKGGIIFSIYKELGIPVRYVGLGESIEDLEPFNPHDFVEALFS